MDFLEHYLVYNSGNMVPKRYHIWSALSILAMTMGRRIYVDQEYFRIHVPMYITLVGRQGLRKTTAKDLAKEMFIDVFPDYPLGASVMSREKIVERLSSDEFCRTYTDENQTQQTYKPLAFFVNELKNFMSINPGGMVEFLTDIYDTKAFAADTIKHGLQPIVNPCINILACETPKWLIEKLKLNIIAGGFSRRMLYIYEIERPMRITFPKKSVEAFVSEAWCKNHLRRIVNLSGPFKWADQAARDFFDKWFTTLPNQEDEVLEGFYEAKDVLALKVAMLLGVAQAEPDLRLTVPLLTKAIGVLENIEDNLPKLSMAVGRNELALPQQRLVELLETKGGWMTEKSLSIAIDKDLNPSEQYSTLRHLTTQGRIYKEQVKFPSGVVRVMVMTAEKYKSWSADGQITKEEPPK